MKIKLNTKFTDRELDEVITSLNQQLHENGFEKFIFDLSQTEFISNQELLVLSAVLKSFYDSDIPFEVILFEKGIPISSIKDRIKRQIIQFWDVWKIWKIVPNNKYTDYFGLDGRTIEKLKSELKYYPKLSEIYNRHSVTPFVVLQPVNNYSEREIQKEISKVYDLDTVVKDLLKQAKCYHPFSSSAMSSIITEELYLNFLDHSGNTSISKFKKHAFMSVSFHDKLDEQKHSKELIERIKKINFETENLPETKDFYFDNAKGCYKNIPYIEFSFLDFGSGIVNTLKDEYLKKKAGEIKTVSDNDVLEYAFYYNSSRHPIETNYDKPENFIPRGLFDILSLVKRYGGLLVVRSNKGKIIYDFSREKNTEAAVRHFGSDKDNFPGTLISIYIPTLPDIGQFNTSTIKPEVKFSKVKPENKKYINFQSIVRKLTEGKSNLYSKVLSELKKEIQFSSQNTLVLISFQGGILDKRLVKKIIYYLLTDYDINKKHNVVILNLPPYNLLQEISAEIQNLNDAFKNFKLHVLPIIEYKHPTKIVKIHWLGIYEEIDKKILDNLIYEQYTIARSDFVNPDRLTGHLNEFDIYGNLLTNFPASSEISHFFLKEETTLIEFEVEELINKHNCIKKFVADNIYLCNGNYYQKEYIELHSLVNDKNDCDRLSRLLFDKIRDTVDNVFDFKFISITTTSHKILKSLSKLNLITADDFVSLDNYHTFETDLTSEIIQPNQKYILICDAVSTGYLAARMSIKLSRLNAELSYIAVIASSVHHKYNTTKSFLEKFNKKMIVLYHYPIPKYTRNDLENNFNYQKIIRINPHTNIPITLSLNETNYKESIVFHTKIDYDSDKNEITLQNQFLNSIDEKAINVGFLKFNNVIHPYFFDTNQILNQLSSNVLIKIFEKINNPKFKTDKLKVFYPRKSGIDFFDFSTLAVVLMNHDIDIIEIERFGTSEGWRFPHSTDYLNSQIENNLCLILDDGSCSGDSLIQMVDEIAFYDAKEIVLLCIIGRVNDHKREFFSRLSHIKVMNSRVIPLSIYFVSHWHIPTYYLDENPNIKEKSWLQKILSFENSPQGIKKTSLKIEKVIEPQTLNPFNDYQYLPRDKISGEIPKKELIMIREELGKVIGYRLYQESFEFFDVFIRKYEIRKRTVNRYKEIELLCATFIYEPYLFDKIVGVLPDVIAKIEEFVRVLIFSSGTIYESLTYKWHKKDIVHLFFIVFKNEKLIQELTLKRFIVLMKFTDHVDSTINYILFKLLKYFPLSAKEFTIKEYDSQIKVLMSKLKNEESVPQKELRKYINFINSLPSRADFSSQVSQLKNSYFEQREPEYHDQKISFNHNVSEMIVTAREIVNDLHNDSLFDIQKLKSISRCWFKIIDFLNPILAFSDSFSEYLQPYPFYELINQTKSLREMVGYIDDVILSDVETVNDVDKWETLKRNVAKIQVFYEVNSVFHQLVEQTDYEAIELVQRLQSELEKNFTVRLEGNLNLYLKFMIKIPKLYAEKLIIKEIFTNMNKYSKKGDDFPVTINIVPIASGSFQLKIENSILNTSTILGNGEGTKSLHLMAQSNLFGFQYVLDYDGEICVQTLNFESV